ncbi:DUF7344 domain-containing protein [Natrarchaeobius oligotrophus]|uniref:DUF7344 domain-containing protein n=1 Tax=Natrarchaeobius chitinivorans TaxID=1679083 RepID=A0A3N6MES8_NATCH|nr:hypothetical protein [Natrarchaeobius chitinivorans]RQG99364.1 hypothetical protein EA472_14145 [Natrarchaeobius chitinivorans]
MKSTHISPEEQTEGGPDEENDRPESERELSEDEIFHLLQNERRRLVLRYLRDVDEAVRMRDVAEQVAAWEHETTVEELTSTQRQRVYIPLYQSHLSKLDEAGVIEYQKNRGIVERKPLADRVDQYLHVDPNDDFGEEQESGETTRHDYYIVATAICYVALLGAVLELPFASFLSGVGLAALILLVFTLVTMTQFVQ